MEWHKNLTNLYLLCYVDGQMKEPDVITCSQLTAPSWVWGE